MNVLGVFGATDVVHPAACLLRDGRLVAFAEDEPNHAALRDRCRRVTADATDATALPFPDGPYPEQGDEEASPG